MTSLVLTHNTSRYLLMHYRELLQELVRRGYRVTVVAPDDGSVPALEALGVVCQCFDMSRRGMNPVAELCTVRRLWSYFRRAAPDAVINFSIKPVIYGAIAARLARVPRVLSMVTGLGYVFTGGSWSRRVLRTFVSGIYRAAFRLNDCVFFQNPEDRDYLAGRTGLDARKTVVLDGTGVDLEYYTPHGAPAPATFLFAGRLLADKGLREFVAAARRLKTRHPESHFLVAGPQDDNPAAIPAVEIEEWVRRGDIEYLGEIADLRPYYARATALVLPSYREGMPRVVLEAMAMGRPVVATDVPGCRHAVSSGVSGLLVRPRDSAALAQAMEQLLLEPELAARMGRNARAQAVERFDIRKVNAVVLDTIRSLFPE